MKIALSRASGHPKFNNYISWLTAADDTIEIVDLIDLSPSDAVAALADVSGLVFTGGPDVHPNRYGSPGRDADCMEIDLKRDELEFALVQPAIERNIPVLGICRGLQVINVALGGTLHVDIPIDCPSDIEHAAVNEVESTHALAVEPGSLIKRISRTLDGPVNSSHHQAIDKIATLLSPSALSEDGIVEAFEWGDAALGGKPFLLGVQWHPERLDASSPFSTPLARHFTAEAAAYSLLLK